MGAWHSLVSSCRLQLLLPGPVVRELNVGSLRMMGIPPTHTLQTWLPPVPPMLLLTLSPCLLSREPEPGSPAPHHAARAPRHDPATTGHQALPALPHGGAASRGPVPGIQHGKALAATMPCPAGSGRTLPHFSTFPSPCPGRRGLGEPPTAGEMGMHRGGTGCPCRDPNQGQGWGL